MTRSALDAARLAVADAYAKHATARDAANDAEQWHMGDLATAARAEADAALAEVETARAHFTRLQEEATA